MLAGGVVRRFGTFKDRGDNLVGKLRVSWWGIRRFGNFKDRGDKSSLSVKREVGEHK